MHIKWNRQRPTQLFSWSTWLAAVQLTVSHFKGHKKCFPKQNIGYLLETNITFTKTQEYGETTLLFEFHEESSFFDIWANASRKPYRNGENLELTMTFFGAVNRKLSWPMDANSSLQQNDTKLSFYSKLLTQYTLFNSKRELAIRIVIQSAKWHERLFTYNSRFEFLRY